MGFQMMVPVKLFKWIEAYFLNKNIIVNANDILLELSVVAKEPLFIPIENRNANIMRNIIVDNVHQESIIDINQGRGYGTAFRNITGFLHTPMSTTVSSL